MNEQKAIDQTGFITKTSAVYCDKFFLRAGIQIIPGLGGALDTLYPAKEQSININALRILFMN